MCALRNGEMSQDLDVSPATMVTFYTWVVDSRVLCPGAWNIYFPRQMSRMKEKRIILFYLKVTYLWKGKGPSDHSKFIVSWIIACL